MSASATLDREPADSYVVIQWTQHWRKLDGYWHRDAVVREADGSTWIYAMPVEQEWAA